MRTSPHKVFWAGFALLVGCLTATPALAAGGGDIETLETILVLLTVVSVAFIATHVVAEWVSKKFGVVTGVEYILVGALLGPVFGVLDEDTLGKVAPALILGTGSLGFLAGLRLNFSSSTTSQSGRAVRYLQTLLIGLVIAVVTMAVVGVVPIAVLGYVASWDVALTYTPLFLCVGAIAMVADLAPLRSLIDFLGAEGEAGTLILSIARVSSSFAVVAFGLIFCVFHEMPAGLLDAELTPLQGAGFWLAIHLFIGTVLGVIFTLFLLRDFEDEKILTVVIGMVFFTSGIAYYLKLSPIFVNFVLGVVLGTTCKQSEHVREMLLSIERPLYIILFFFGGASLVFDVSLWAFAVFVPYLVLRWLGRTAGGVATSRFFGRMNRIPQPGPALWAPGGLSIAMLLNFSDVYGDIPYIDEAFLGLLMAIVASEVLAYRYSRRWLIDAADVALPRVEGDAEEVA